MARYIVLDRSPSISVVFLPSAKITGRAILAYDDGVNKSAVVCDDIDVKMLVAEGFLDPSNEGLGKQKLAADARMFGNTGGLPLPARILIEWAMKKLRAKSGRALEGSERTESRIDYEACPVIGQIRYDGWPPVSKKSAHAFKDFHASMCEAVELCARAWAWKASGLVVSFHTRRRAMGLAYAPGMGNRHISLKVELFEKYDLKSIHRTVLHELAHHAREEMFYRERYRGDASHDSKFCEMLGMVDPTVRGSQESCRFFADEEDSSVAQAAAKKHDIVYSSEAGVMVVGFGPDKKMRFRWNATGNHEWRSKWEIMYDNAFVGFVKRFPATERRLIVVNVEPRKRRGETSPRSISLEMFIDECVALDRGMVRMREALT